MNELHNKIIDVFFNRVVQDVQTGSINIYGHIYNIGFNTIINDPNKALEKHINTEKDFETLYINNYDLFCSTLFELGEEIVQNKSLWVTNGYNSVLEEKLYSVLSLMWSNATYEDLNNPIAFIRRYTSFLRDHTFDDLTTPKNIGMISCLDDYSVVVEKKESLNVLETPYYLNIYLEKYENEKLKVFLLPRVMYGIEEDDSGRKIGYIYAIQGTKDVQQDKDAKNIRRKFMKVDSGVLAAETDEYKDYIDTKSDYYPENIFDVSPPALISLTIALGIFKSKGINIVKAPDLLPIRWYAKRQALINTVRYKKKYHPDINVEKYAKDAINEHLRIQTNLTEKFIRTFRRLDYHFNNINIDTLPIDGAFLRLTNNDEYSCNDQLLNQLYLKASEYETSVIQK